MCYAMLYPYAPDTIKSQWQEQLEAALTALEEVVPEFGAVEERRKLDERDAVEAQFAAVAEMMEEVETDAELPDGEREGQLHALAGYWAVLLIRWTHLK